MSTRAAIVILTIGGMPDPLLDRWPRSWPVLSLIASAEQPCIRWERRGGQHDGQGTNAQQYQPPRNDRERCSRHAGAGKRTSLGAALSGHAACTNQGPAGLDGYGPARARRGLRPVGLLVQPAF